MINLENELQNTNLYFAQNSDIENIAEIMTFSFEKDAYIHYLLPDKKYSHNKAKAIFLFSLTYTFKYGYVIANSPNMEGIILMLPPGETHVNAWKSICSGVFKLPFNVYPSILHKLSVYGSFAHKFHKKYASKPHWYLFSISVSPLHQGKGVATQLLSPLLDFFDRNQYACYLETHNPNNVNFYKHFDFEVMEQQLLPKTTKPHWALLRNPKGG